VTAKSFLELRITKIYTDKQRQRNAGLHLASPYRIFKEALAALVLHLDGILHNEARQLLQEDPNAEPVLEYLEFL